MYGRLVKKNRERDPEGFESIYGALVSHKFRRKYSQSKCEAVVNNYLSDPTNEVYLAEFTEMQAYRKACKEEAKADLGI